jgi:hypothetical protein
VTAKPACSFDFHSYDIAFVECEGNLPVKEYRSIFGPCFQSKTNMNACDNTGITEATRRITGVRNPERPGLHERLRTNQFAMRTRIGSDIDTWTHEFQARLRNIIPEDTVGEMMNRWTDNPHPKKKLRERARRDILSDGRDHHRMKVANVEYKCKPGELLADGKYLRGIGDLTCPGSTVLGYYMDYVKEAFELPYHQGDGVCEFLKAPQIDSLSACFAKLVDPQGVYFLYFSDDSCIGIQCQDGVFIANMDISACDGSNYAPVFETLKAAMSVDSRFQRDIDGAFAQLSQPAVVHSQSYKYKVTLRPTGPVLYSGSVLTTSVNNMANTLIFLSIMRKLPAVRYTGAMATLIEEAAAEVGYILKVDVCEHPEDLQFLKHSPCFEDGLVIPFLNLGVWMRGFGTIVGELPGGKPLTLSERVRRFNSDVVKSRVHAGNHLIHDAFRTKLVRETLVSFDILGEPNRNERISVEALARRYRVPVVWLEELAELIRRSDVCQLVCHPVIGVIMGKDYGY